MTQHEFPSNISEPKTKVFSPIEGVIPQGNLNTNMLVTDTDGKRYIRRKENPNGRMMELPFVRSEYAGVGFLDNLQNGFRLRSSREQHAFAQKLADRGVPAIVPAHSLGDVQYIEYLQDAKSLSQLLESNHSSGLLATYNVTTALADAHGKNAVIGDRWGPNELVLPSGEVKFIDFDIEIWGAEAREFEMASLLYFSSYFAQLGSKDSLPGLANLYRHCLQGAQFKGIYDIDMLNRYIKRYSRYFSEAEKYSWTNKSESNRFFYSVIQQ